MTNDDGSLSSSTMNYSGHDRVVGDSARGDGVLSVNSRDRTGTPHVDRTLQDLNPEGRLRSVPTDPTCGPNEVRKQSVANLPPILDVRRVDEAVESRPNVRRTRRVVVRTCGPTAENEEACAAVSGDQRVSYNSLQCEWSEWVSGPKFAFRLTWSEWPTVVAGVGGVRASSGEAGREARDVFRRGGSS
ncbi:hypothetical protein PC117_g11733 [Phytophthora cactorum]|uniref:Uncharacterized protein n=1 Tax=Phytophthora cactorum TaxID=29920 RepID=A0A8T1D7M3_9STRA|nr:hypothetical protein PC117_g11733 [Phytophthora cactorum]